jgi:very-short-patch-repair endonuclease
MTPAERKLWNALRARRCAGIKFHRQVVFGHFIVDFCAVEARLIIEVDGGIHAYQRKYDTERQQLLEQEGFRVIRFRNDQVLDDLSGTLLTIVQVVGGIYKTRNENPSHPSPREEKGRG